MENVTKELRTARHGQLGEVFIDLCNHSGLDEEDEKLKRALEGWLENNSLNLFD